MGVGLTYIILYALCALFLLFIVTIAAGLALWEKWTIRRQRRAAAKAAEPTTNPAAQ